MEKYPEISERLVMQTHGLILSESENESDCNSDFDQIYEQYKPPPLDLELIQNNIVVISPKKIENVWEKRIKNRAATTVDIYNETTKFEVVENNNSETKNLTATQKNTALDSSKCLNQDHSSNVLNDYAYVAANTINISEKKKKKKKKKKWTLLTVPLIPQSENTNQISSKGKTIDNTATSRNFENNDSRNVSSVDKGLEYTQDEEKYYELYKLPPEYLEFIRTGLVVVSPEKNDNVWEKRIENNPATTVDFNNKTTKFEIVENNNSETKNLTVTEKNTALDSNKCRDQDHSSNVLNDNTINISEEKTKKKKKKKSTLLTVPIIPQSESENKNQISPKEKTIDNTATLRNFENNPATTVDFDNKTTKFEVVENNRSETKNLSLTERNTALDSNKCLDQDHSSNVLNDYEYVAANTINISEKKTKKKKKMKSTLLTVPLIPQSKSENTNQISSKVKTNDTTDTLRNFENNDSKNVASIDKGLEYTKDETSYSNTSSIYENGDIWMQSSVINQDLKNENSSLLLEDGCISDVPGGRRQKKKHEEQPEHQSASDEKNTVEVCSGKPLDLEVDEQKLPTTLLPNQKKKKRKEIKQLLGTAVELVTSIDTLPGGKSSKRYTTNQDESIDKALKKYDFPQVVEKIPERNEQSNKEYTDSKEMVSNCFIPKDPFSDLKEACSLRNNTKELASSYVINDEHNAWYENSRLREYSEIYTRKKPNNTIRNEIIEGDLLNFSGRCERNQSNDILVTVENGQSVVWTDNNSVRVPYGFQIIVKSIFFFIFLHLVLSALNWLLDNSICLTLVLMYYVLNY